MAVSMPIRQSSSTHELSLAHGQWLIDRFPNVKHEIVDLTATFDQFEQTMQSYNSETSELAFANSRSRLRMICLYQIAQSQGGIVVGTGNRVEDFGVGFFTKYGDGGVDISPIGDCLKTEVWEMGQQLGILQSIIDAPPTDGLWNDGRTDEDQLGMSYEDLEWAMERYDLGDEVDDPRVVAYAEIRRRNLHKMLPIPVYKIRN
jgi:NAD+ synthase